MQRGRFITFEGGEGTGKSTQARRLAERLRERGMSVVLTREPGGSPRAEQIREVILSGAAKPLGPVGETVLFYAARGDHLKETIEPALARGDWVICDRFSDSTRAYQGAGGGVDANVIDALDKLVVGNSRPDLTLVLDVPLEVSLARAGARRGDADADRFEGEDRAFHERLRQAFLDIAWGEPRRCSIIDANAEPGEVAERIWQRVAQRLPIADNDPR